MRHRGETTFDICRLFGLNLDLPAAMGGVSAANKVQFAESSRDSMLVNRRRPRDGCCAVVLVSALEVSAAATAGGVNRSSCFGRDFGWVWFGFRGQVHQDAADVAIHPRVHA